MSFIIGSKELERALTQVSQAVPSKAIIPLIENVLFTLKDGKLELYGTDTENSIIRKLDVQTVGEGEFSVALPHALITRTLKEIPEQPVTFEFSEETNNVTLKTDSGEFSITGEPAENFPPPQEADEKGLLIFAKEKLGEVIGTTLFATAKTDTASQANMLGVHFKFLPEKIEIAATNSQQLVVYSLPNSTGTQELELLIHHKGMDLLNKLLSSFDGEEVTIKYGQRFVVFALNDLVLSTRLIDAKFPNYNLLLDKEKPISATLDREDFLKKLKIAKAYSHKVTQIGKLTFEEDFLTLTAEDKEGQLKKATQKMNAVFSGASTPWEIAVNIQHMIDLVSHITSSNIILQMESPNKAFLIKPEETAENEDITMLTMPLYLN